MKVVFITGKQGAGKSYVAKMLERQKLASVVNVDSILKAGAKISLVPREQDPCDWPFWENKWSDGSLNQILKKAVAKNYGTHMSPSIDLIVEGAILCNAWFLDAIHKALKMTLNLGHYSTFFVYVDPSNSLLLENINDRVERGARKVSELELFPSEDAIAQRHRSFDAAIAKDPVWRAFPTKEDALDAVTNILNGKI